MLSALADPNVAFLLLITGVLGLYWELKVPGGILPGVTGALLLCAGAFGIWQDMPTWYGSLMIFIALVLLALELKVGSYGASGILGAILLSAGAIALIRGPQRIHPALAVTVSATVCVIVVFLGYLAMRARKSSFLTGVQRLVGEVGVSRSEIDSKGTVFVRGEYWQAKSRSPIPAGKPVAVESVQGLTLHVKEK